MTRRRKNYWMMMGAFTVFCTLFALAMTMRIGLGLQGLWLALGYGAFTAALAWTSIAYREYLQRRAFQGKKQASVDTDAHQQRMVEVDLPLEDAYDVALAGLQALDGQYIPMPDDPLLRLESLLPRRQKLRLIRADRQMGDLEAALRLRSLGITDPLDFSRISLRLQRLDAGTTRIQISSSPGMWHEYDLGRNMHYVNHLALHLRRESDQRQAAGRLSQDTRLASAAQDDANQSSAQAST